MRSNLTDRAEEAQGSRGVATVMVGPPCPYPGRVIFKRVGSGRPYPDHGLTPRDWAALPPQQLRLDQLVTTKDTLHLAALLDEDSTFFGDLFAHVVRWRGEDYLEDGLRSEEHTSELQSRQYLVCR